MLRKLSYIFCTLQYSYTARIRVLCDSGRKPGQGGGADFPMADGR